MKSVQDNPDQVGRLVMGEPDAAGLLPRLFSLNEANRMLPLVRHIMRDVVRLARSVRHCRFHLAFISRGGDEIEYLFPREFQLLRDRLAVRQARLMECMEELKRLGIELEAPTIGLVDFPACVHGHAIYYCWRYDEPAIRYWHWLHEGFVDRRPLDELGEMVLASTGEFGGDDF
jgi:hypothetical protein